MGAPEGRGEVGAGYVAAAAVEDYSGGGLGWFSGWGGDGGFVGSGVLGFCESFGGFGFESLTCKSLGLFRCVLQCLKWMFARKGRWYIML